MRNTIKWGVNWRRQYSFGGHSTRAKSRNYLQRDQYSMKTNLTTTLLTSRTTPNMDYGDHFRTRQKVTFLKYLINTNTQSGEKDKKTITKNQLKSMSN